MTSKQGMLDVAYQGKFYVISHNKSSSSAIKQEMAWMLLDGCIVAYKYFKGLKLVAGIILTMINISGY